MTGLITESGITVIFNKCYEHLKEDGSIAIIDGQISTSVLSSPTVSKCAHIHCYECGCIRSRIKCVLKEPESKIKLASPGPVSREMFEENQKLFDYEKVEYTGPRGVHFTIEWQNTEGDKFFIQGNLPPLAAQIVINEVNNYRG